jgi:hypothetical protein
LLVIAPSRLDLDIEAHLELLVRTPALRTRLSQIGDDSSLMLGRAVAATVSDRRSRTLVTVGRVALAAARWFPGRHLHLLGPGASRAELDAVKTVERSRVVAANQMVGLLVPDTRVIGPPCPTRSISPGRVRKLLGVRDDQRLVFVPAVPARSSGHRLALWVVGILRFLDDRWRVVTLSRDAGVFHDFAAQTGQPHLLVSHPSLDAMSLAGASDIAFLAAEGAFDLLPLVACAARGVPIVAPDRPHLRSLKSQAGLCIVTDPKPRRMALALRDDPDPIAPDPAWLTQFSEPNAERGWLDAIDPCVAVQSTHRAITETR